MRLCELGEWRGGSLLERAMRVCELGEWRGESLLERAMRVCEDMEKGEKRVY